VLVTTLAFVNECFDVANFARNSLALSGFGYFFPAVNEGIYATRENRESSDSGEREDKFPSKKRRISFENKCTENFVSKF